MDLYEYTIASRGGGGGGASGKITISQNGTDLNIAQYATADVAVQPNLQTAEATPTEQTQTITPDGQHDGLSSVQVNPIPSQYIVPTGKTTLTQNATDVDIAQYASADVAVPMPEEYAVGGSLQDSTAVGYYFKRGIATIKNQFIQSFADFEWADIPDTVTSMGNGALYNLPKFNLRSLPTSLTSIGNDCFRNDSILQLQDGLPSGLKTIGGQAFRYCYALCFDSFPNSITSMGSYTFSDCIELLVDNLPTSMAVIPQSCFSYCYKITVHEIPAGVTTISQNAFYDCRAITSITFKGTPTTIASDAFAKCTNLLNFYCPWSEGAVAGAPWGAVNATITYDYTGG